MESIEGNIEEYLLIWVNNICRNYSADLEDESLDLKISFVGSKIFDEESMSSDIVLEKIASFYNVSVNKYEIETILEYLLVHSVSPDCSIRSEFVENIMSLDQEVQVNLMEIIKNNMEKRQSEYQETENFINDDSKMDLSPVKDTFLCKTCQEFKEKEINLTKKFDEMIESYSQEISKLKDQLTTESSKVVDSEMLVLQKDESLFRNQSYIDELEKKNEELSKKIKNQTNFTEQICAMQDEIDILRPKAEKLDYAEVQLEKLRSKLDELNDVRSQLKEESSKHSETYDRLIQIENEVQELRKLKPQIEEYRTQLAELNISYDELMIRLNQKTEEISSLQYQNALLKDGKEDRLFEYQNLAEELKTTTEQLREKERSVGIGDGISELNPVLMQELTKLRNENEDLTKKLEKTSLENLEKLEKLLSDEQCKTKSLQSKWVFTKDELESARNDIKSLKSLLCINAANLSQLETQFMENNLFAEENFLSLKVEFQSKWDACNSDWRSKLENEINDKIEIKNQLENELHDISMQLKEACEKINQLQDKNEQLSTELNCHRDEIEELNKKRKIFEMDVEADRNALLSEYNDKFKIQQEAFDAELEKKNKYYTDLIETEIQKGLDLNACLEEEKLKRRKVERQKKKLESESFRQKSKIQELGNSEYGSTHDIDSALAEIKSMDIQIKELKKENQELKSLIDINGNRAVQYAHTETHSKYLRGPGRNIRSTGYDEHDFEATSFKQPQRVTDVVDYSDCMEESELLKKKIETLMNEKREILSTSLVEKKERNELNQKLIQSENEVNTLKGEVRKLQLEKQRMERKMLIFSSQEANQKNQENVCNAAAF